MPDLTPAWLELPLPEGWTLDEGGGMLLDDRRSVVVYWTEDHAMFRALVNDAIRFEYTGDE